MTAEQRRRLEALPHAAARKAAVAFARDAKDDVAHARADEEVGAIVPWHVKGEEGEEEAGDDDEAGGDGDDRMCGHVEDDMWEVERLIGRRRRLCGRRQVWQYLVRWVGWSDADSWEAADDIDPALVAEYDQRHPRQDSVCRLKAGARVRARWSISCGWYSGCVTDVCEDGTYSVAFDDGDTATGLRASEVLPAEGGGATVVTVGTGIAETQRLTLPQLQVGLWQECLSRHGWQLRRQQQEQPCGDGGARWR